MLTYFLETLVFQLVFLLAFDLLLKKETFFQWNRAYLIVSFALSIGLPWLKIEALKTRVSQDFVFYPEYLWQTNDLGTTLETSQNIGFWSSLNGYEWFYVAGVVFMTLWFALKLFRIYRLRAQGLVYRHPQFTQILVQQSDLAFSFFKQVFLGDRIPEEQKPQIIAHELVHIRQWHSVDLLFFEVMRMAFWFNPMVYLYQNRVAELHEFIADAKVAKTHRKEQYQLLLSQVFQTQKLSFVNQFFKQSLIKKRIVMLTKKRSKAVDQLKYMLLLPLVMGMLVYTSCETTPEESSLFSADVVMNGNDITFSVYDLNNLSEAEREEQAKLINLIESEQRTGTLTIGDTFKNIMEINYENGQVSKVDVSKKDAENAVPFGLVEQVPIFPGCEDAADKKTCFQEQMQQHIMKHFNYPKEAQDLGIQGRVSVMFTIDENGAITNIKKRGPHELLENEVERIIGRLPKMVPGKNGGKTVKVPFSIPITFRLSKENDSNTTLYDNDQLKVTGNQITENGRSIFVGQVLDSAGMPLPGVTVALQDGSTAVLTDFKGAFKMMAKKGDHVQFQYEGLPTVELQI